MTMTLITICDGCHHWWHAKCVQVDAKLYAAMTSYKPEKPAAGLYWYCESCNSEIRELRAELKEMRDKQEVMGQELKLFREELEKMKKTGGEEVVQKKVEDVVKGLGLEGIKSEWKAELKKQEVDIKRSFARVVKEDEEVTESVRWLVKGDEGIKKSFVDIVKEEAE